jgi:hydroxymethylpyrimidine pyrophosphatase-like HAD family hydrolase
MTKLFIFDLDGTLTPQRPSSTTPFRHTLLPRVRETCIALRARGHTLAVGDGFH